MSLNYKAINKIPPKLGVKRASRLTETWKRWILAYLTENFLRPRFENLTTNLNLLKKKKKNHRTISPNDLCSKFIKFLKHIVNIWNWGRASSRAAKLKTSHLINLVILCTIRCPDFSEKDGLSFLFRFS